MTNLTERREQAEQIERLYPRVVEVAEQLEASGFAPEVIADTLMSVGLSLGAAALGPRATSKVLFALAERFAAEADLAEGSPRH